MNTNRPRKHVAHKTGNKAGGKAGGKAGNKGRMEKYSTVQYGLDDDEMSVSIQPLI